MADDLLLFPRPAPNPLDVAYAAGFFDGEGCVSLTQVTKGNFVKAQIMVANGNAASLKKLQAIWGGTIYLNRRRKGKPYWNPQFVWMLSEKAIPAFLNDVRPFLEIKGPQADNCLAFLALKQRGRRMESHLASGFLAKHRDLGLRARAPEAANG